MFPRITIHQYSIRFRSDQSLMRYIHRMPYNELRLRWHPKMKPDWIQKQLRQVNVLSFTTHLTYSRSRRLIRTAIMLPTWMNGITQIQWSLEQSNVLHHVKNVKRYPVRTFKYNYASKCPPTRCTTCSLADCYTNGRDGMQQVRICMWCCTTSRTTCSGRGVWLLPLN